MPTVILTSSHPRLLWPGIRTTWGQVYDEHPEEYPDLYEVLTSEKAYELDVQVTPYGLAPVKPEGSGMFYQGEVQGTVTQYAHIPYGIGYIVTYEEMINNLYKEVATRRAEGNAFAMRQTVENVGAFVYNNAFVTTYFTTADGVALGSTAHVNTLGGTFSNVLNPAAPLSPVALEDLCVQIMGTQNDAGLLISVMPRSLIVSRQQWFNANRILGSVLQSGGGDNDINVLMATNAFPDGIKLNHYLTNANPWFIRTNCPHGMTFFWRVRPMLDQDNDFDTKNAKASSYMNFSVGCTDPRGWAGSNAS